MKVLEGTISGLAVKILLIFSVSAGTLSPEFEHYCSERTDEGRITKNDELEIFPNRDLKGKPTFRITDEGIYKGNRLICERDPHLGLLHCKENSPFIEIEVGGRQRFCLPVAKEGQTIMRIPFKTFLFWSKIPTVGGVWIKEGSAKTWAEKDEKLKAKILKDKGYQETVKALDACVSENATSSECLVDLSFKEVWVDSRNFPQFKEDCKHFRDEEVAAGVFARCTYEARLWPRMKQCFRPGGSQTIRVFAETFHLAPEVQIHTEDLLCLIRKEKTNGSSQEKWKLYRVQPLK